MNVIPIGTILYRGGDEVEDLPPESWFALDHKSASIYGLVQIYQTIQPINLLRLDNPQNVQQLWRQALQLGQHEVATAIQKRFRISADEAYVIRKSQVQDDRKILHFLCQLNYDGFYADRLPLNESRSQWFHAEIALCHAPQLVSIGKMLTQQTDQARLKDLSWKLKKSRASQARKLRSPLIGKKLFD